MNLQYVRYYSQIKNSAEKNHKMILFPLFTFVFCGTIDNELLTTERNYNPECPSEGAARDCEDDCIFLNTQCILDCGLNQECIRQCSRDHAQCTDACPCYPGCYDGCPCSFASLEFKLLIINFCFPIAIFQFLLNSFEVNIVNLVNHDMKKNIKYAAI